MKNMTVRQLYDACQNHRYLLLRLPSGYKMGVNGRVAKLAQRLSPKEWEKETDFVSYKFCGILEYIEHKHPFFD
jgi:hypothetical protein